MPTDLIFYLPFGALQIRVKHMISQGVIEQTPFGYGYNRASMSTSGRLLETNTENLLQMVRKLFFYPFSYILQGEPWCLLHYNLLVRVQGNRIGSLHRMK